MSTDERDVALFFLGWRSFVDDADTVLAEHGLGRMHHRVLYVVARSPGISVGELAGALGISRQALHRREAVYERLRRATDRAAARRRATGGP